ncbi:SAVED domain-containing protein [Sorangium sp. So ce1151]|uniref:SAVED domain-containing protein n=1 Tax=Sorangium sp. So ce1151 TaxID=3133332 RepID=UPI003F5E241D
MSDPSRLLVISHPVLAPIGRDQVEHAIPVSEHAGGWDHVEITPVRTELGRLHEIDWAAALAEQERLFAERLRGEIAGRRRMAYFGFAPIPLATHLGYRMTRSVNVNVYQHNRFRFDWAWSSDDSASTAPPLKPQIGLPEYGSRDEGPVVIRVSTSHRIAPWETAEVVPSSLAEVDVMLAVPGEEALRTQSALTEIVVAFNEALSRVKSMFPRLTAIHLFAAVPVGLAFRLGAQVNPTIYPEVMTYQYWRKGTPRYRQAIVLAERCRAALSEPCQDLVASVGSEVVVGAAQEVVMNLYNARSRFLDAPSFRWAEEAPNRFFDIMVRAYDSVLRAREILEKSGIDRYSINFEQPMRAIWHEALEVAAREGLTRRLAQRARTDKSVTAYHDELDKIIEATHTKEESACQT